MRLRFPRAFSAFILALLIAAATDGQTAGVGSTQGKVTDETGAVLPGATVTFKSPASQDRLTRPIRATCLEPLVQSNARPQVNSPLLWMH